MQRGEVYFTKTGSANNAGFTVWASRPAVVVSTNDINYNERVVEVVFLTTAPKKHNDYHVQFICRDRMATALCEQVTTVDATFLTDFVMRVPENVMQDICKSLDLRPEYADDVSEQDESNDSYWKNEAAYWKRMYVQQLKITAEALNDG